MWDRGGTSRDDRSPPLRTALPGPSHPSQGLGRGLVLVALLLLSVADRAGGQEHTVATDKSALVALYDATDRASWTSGKNWTSDLHRYQRHADLLEGSAEEVGRTTADQNQSWNVEIEPHGRAAVTITLPSGSISAGNRSLSAAGDGNGGGAASVAADGQLQRHARFARRHEHVHFRPRIQRGRRRPELHDGARRLHRQRR